MYEELAWYCLLIYYIYTLGTGSLIIDLIFSNNDTSILSEPNNFLLEETDVI